MHFEVTIRQVTEAGTVEHQFVTEQESSSAALLAVIIPARPMLGEFIARVRPVKEDHDLRQDGTP